MPPRVSMQSYRLPDGYFISVPSRGGFAPRTDSGQVSAYRPAPQQKPQQHKLMQRILDRFLKTFHRPDPMETTEQGSSGAASPSTYELTLWQQRYERRQVIADCRLMEKDDPRVHRSVLMFAREAVRKGVTITVADPKTKNVSRNYRVAREVCQRIQDFCNPLLQSWARMLVVEGDLFIQAVVHEDELIEAKRMPAASMERLSDQTDAFIDVSRAFAQVDVVTNEEQTTFPLPLMHQLRWNHTDGERYGESELIAIRRHRRLLEIQEEAQAVRRMTRGPQRILWNIGHAASGRFGMPDEVEAFKSANGFVGGTREIWNSSEIARDIFGNGMITAQEVGGDSGLSDVGDLEYMLEILGAGLPTPLALMGIGAKNINRDSLTQMRGEWLKNVDALADMLKILIHWLVDLGLMLKGIAPETVPYTVHFSESSIDTKQEIVDRIIKLRANQLPGFIPDPLISRKHAMQLLAEIIDVEDVEAEERQIQTELQHLQNQQVAAQQALNGNQPGGPNEAPQAPDLSGGPGGGSPAAMKAQEMPGAMPPGAKGPAGKGSQRYGGLPENAP